MSANGGSAWWHRTRQSLPRFVRIAVGVVGALVEVAMETAEHVWRKRCDHYHPETREFLRRSDD